MTSEAGLRDEACRLARYLAGAALDEQAVAHYVRWHAIGAPRRAPVDRVLQRFSSFGRVGLALADAYAARFCRDGLLRRKLVLVLALLETTAPAFETVDRPVSSGPVGFWLRMIGRGASAVALTVAALVIIGPAHLVTRASSPRSESP